MGQDQEKYSQLVGSDDHALARVPDSARYAWTTGAIQRLGATGALGQFLLGATLGYGMSFWKATLALVLGSTFIELVTIFIGIMGMREGLNTTLLARWAGLGRHGTSVLGIAVGVSLIGWFGVQNGIFAKGAHQIVGGPPVWVWAVIGGVTLTLVAARGFHLMAWVGWVAVPAFFVLMLYSIGAQLSDHPLGTLLGAPSGEIMSLGTGATLVAGGSIAGALVSPDMMRFSRTAGDVVKQVLISITLGQFVVALTGVLLAHAIKTGDVVQIIVTTSGVMGVIILALSVVQINVWNLYESSLGLTNALDTLFGLRKNRAVVALVIGAMGTALAAVGILDRFESFLSLLGMALPPVAAIMVADYFVLRRHRAALAESRRTGELPASVEGWTPVALATWAIGAALAMSIDIGIPSINSFVVSFALYIVGMKARQAICRRKAAGENGVKKDETSGSERIRP